MTVSAWARRFSQVATSVVGKNLPVSVKDRGPAPGWNDEKEISILNRVVRSALEHGGEAFASSKGLVYHEIAHSLYTPSRTGAPYNNIFGDYRLQMAANILEDARIECMLLAKYPVLAPYLEALIASEIVMSSKAEETWPLLAGRKYLSSKLLSRSKGAWPRPTADEIESILDEFITLRFPKDNYRVYDMVARFADLLDGPGHTKDFQFDLDGSAEESAGEDIETEAGARVEASEDATSTRGVRNAAREAAKEAADEVAEEVAEDLKKIRRNVDPWAGGGSSDYLSAVGTTSPSGEAETTYRRAYAEFSRLIAAAAPQWERRRSSGRMRAARVMRADIRGVVDLTPFDRWSTGGDASDAELVIIVDQSGSMDSAIRSVAQMLHGLVTAGHDSGFSVTVLGFGSPGEWTTHYLPHEHPGNKVLVLPTPGSTDPGAALAEAAVVMEQSRKAHKLCLVLTDGEWNAGNYRAATDRIRSAGGATTVIDYRQGVASGRRDMPPRYGVDAGHMVGDIHAIGPVMTEVITASLTRGGGW